MGVHVSHAFNVEDLRLVRTHTPVRMHNLVNSGRFERHTERACKLQMPSRLFHGSLTRAFLLPHLVCHMPMAHS
ncbi:uncharacterized protein DS421_11g329770 [Arachis hypogaea]|nr:uncharacterized protein DS421_11g329770 [Arachis hypogaea]